MSVRLVTTLFVLLYITGSSNPLPTSETSNADRYRWMEKSSQGEEKTASRNEVLSLLKDIYRVSSRSTRSTLQFQPSQTHQRRKRLVSGEDERDCALDTSTLPYSAMGFFTTGCSGFFISPRTVLTAGECVFDIETSKWKDPIAFFKGMSCKEAGEYISWEKIYVFTDYSLLRNPFANLAVVVLKEDYKASEYLGLAYYENKTGLFLNSTVSGYSTDISYNYPCLCDTECVISEDYDFYSWLYRGQDRSRHYLLTQCDFDPYASGGPVIPRDTIVLSGTADGSDSEGMNPDMYAIGVNAGGRTNSNTGVVLVKERFEFIQYIKCVVGEGNTCPSD